MPEHPHFDDEAIVNPETHHEESDVNVRALLTFVVIFIVFAAVVHVALWLLFKFYVNVEKSQAPPPLTQMSRPANADVPEVPRLQPFPTEEKAVPTSIASSPVGVTPVADMEKMRADEDKILNNAGWIDRQKGVVHIPIEQAKQLALQRGVYQVNTATAAPVAPVAVPGAAKAAPTPKPNQALAGSSTTTGTQQQ